MKKFLLSLMFVSVVFGYMIPAQAQTLSGDCDDANDLVGLNCMQGTNLGNEDPRVIITRIINVSLGLLGIVATVLMIYAGFRWMTAGGNDEHVTSARKIMFAAVAGLVIILMSYSISSWVLNNLVKATNSTYEQSLH